MRHLITITLALVLGGCWGETRQQKWDRQSGAERIKSGDNPRNHPPGHGLNRELMRPRRRVVA